MGTAACLAALFAAGGAQAAQRYAAQEANGGEPCTQAAPCSLKNAVSKAKSGDEVVVTGGNYAIFEAIATEAGANGISVHGDTSGPMPTILGSLSGGSILRVLGTGSSVGYLDVRNDGSHGTAIQCGTGAVVDRVRATETGDSGTAFQQGQECAVRDSLLRATGENSTALLSYSFFPGGTGVARNVTALADGAGSTGARSVYSDVTLPGTHTLDIRNSIVSGAASDLVATSGIFGAGDIIVSNSNFDSPKHEGSGTIADAGGNQTATPLFVNTAGGDYSEAAGSPTIDAGVADQLGSLDLAGNPRVLGAAPDIGAYEFVPPVGELRSITFKPVTFRAANFGEAVISRRKRPPVGAKVIYNLSAPATVVFSAERGFKGRRVGGKCKKVNHANATRKTCRFYKPVNGSFAVSGANSLDNEFEFSGRIGGRELPPGTYKLVGRTGTTLKRGLFHIVK